MTVARSGPAGWVALLAVMAATAALLLFRLDYPALWRDEIFSVNYIRHDTAYLLDLQRAGERHPPGHFLTLKAWTAGFGDSRVSVRALSALFAVLCLPLLYLIVRPVFGMRIALLSALFLGVFPGLVHYGREARMYAELFFFLLLAIWFYGHLLYRDRPGRIPAGLPAWAAIIGFALALAATFHLQYTAAIYYLCFFVITVAAAVPDRDLALLRNGATGLGLATILALPQVVHMLGFVAPGGDEWIAPTSLRTLYQTVLGAFPFAWWAKPAMLGVYGAGTAMIWRTDRRFGLVFLCLPLVGIAALAVIGIWRPMLLVRTVQPLSLLAPVALAVVVARLPRPAGPVAAAALVAVHALALRADYPPARQAMFAEEAADMFAGLDPALDRVYHIAHLGEHFELARIAGRERFVAIGFADPAGQFAAIRARFEACHPRNLAQPGPGCGTTIVIMERDPRFEPQAAAEWFAFLDGLAEQAGPVRIEEYAGYVAYVATAAGQGG